MKRILEFFSSYNKKLKESLRQKCCKSQNRETFCLSNNIAFVKCMSCGAESMPWQVTPKTGEAWRSIPENQLKLKRLFESGL